MIIIQFQMHIFKNRNNSIGDTGRQASVLIKCNEELKEIWRPEIEQENRFITLENQIK